MTNRAKILLLFMIMLILWCSSCEIVESGDPASSRELTFDEIFSLSQDNPVILADVIVQEVYPEICENKYEEGKYILAYCKIQTPFYVSSSCPNQTDLSTTNSECLLWFPVDHISEQYYTELLEMMKQADSLVIYANDEPSLVGRGCLDQEVLEVLKEYGLDCSVSKTNFTDPPSLYIRESYMWSLIPIVDGKVDGTVIQKAVEDGCAEMAYDMDVAKDSRISSGDTIEEVYTFLNEYVKSESKNREE